MQERAWRFSCGLIANNKRPINMHKFLLILFIAVLPLPLIASDSNTTVSYNNHTVTVQMHDGGKFSIAVGSDPVKIKIVCAEGKTVGSVMLNDIDLTAQLDGDGYLTLNNPDNADTAITSDSVITINYSEPAQQ